MGDEFRTEHEIMLCKKCDGTGVFKWSELADYHKGEYDFYSETCKECNGTGRIVKTKKWQVTYEPFDPKKWTDKNIRFKLNEEDKKKK
jgi:DnaJ-class molecular chaperone